MAMRQKHIGTFMTAWPARSDLRDVIDLADKRQLSPQIGLRDSWSNVGAAIEALLGRKVAGKVVLTVN